jgi:hypothetical protein
MVRNCGTTIEQHSKFSQFLKLKPLMHVLDESRWTLDGDFNCASPHLSAVSSFNMHIKVAKWRTSNAVRYCADITLNPLERGRWV